MYFLNQAGWQFISVSQLTKKEMEEQLQGFDVKIEASQWQGSTSNITISLQSGNGKAFIQKCEELWPNSQETYVDGGWPQYYIPLYYKQPQEEPQNND